MGKNGKEESRENSWFSLLLLILLLPHFFMANSLKTGPKIEIWDLPTQCLYVSIHQDFEKRRIGKQRRGKEAKSTQQEEGQGWGEWEHSWMLLQGSAGAIHPIQPTRCSKEGWVMPMGTICFKRTRGIRPSLGLFYQTRWLSSLIGSTKESKCLVREAAVLRAGSARSSHFIISS